MPTNTHADIESIDLEPRTRRALERKLSVTPDIGRARGAANLALVTSGNSGNMYLVDVRAGTCECPDSTRRDPAGGCYHVRRARIALGEHTDATPRVAAADGGELLQVAERDADESDRERPADCACTPTIDGASGEEIGALPCWPCVREGFETVNPAFPGLEGDDA